MHVVMLCQKVNKDMQLGNITKIVFLMLQFHGTKSVGNFRHENGHTAYGKSMEKMLCTIAKASINNSVKGKASGW